MISYAGLHVNYSDSKRVAEAIQEFQTKVAGRHAKCFEMNSQEANRLVAAGHFLVKYFMAKPESDGWVEVVPSFFNFWGLDKISDYLSKELKCAAIVLGYQTTAGQNYFRLSEAGACRRKLWFSTWETIYANEGDPLEFEAKHKADAIASLEPEDHEEIDEMQPEAKETIGLPDCEAFANALGCKSFLTRGPVMDEIPSVFVVKSRPKWMFFA